jgi:hypothetical protein
MARTKPTPKREPPRTSTPKEDKSQVGASPPSEMGAEDESPGDARQSRDKARTPTTTRRR